MGLCRKDIPPKPLYFVPGLSCFFFSHAPRAPRARRKGQSPGTQCGTDWLARLSVVHRLSWKRCLGRNPAGVTSEVPEEREKIEGNIQGYREGRKIKKEKKKIESQGEENGEKKEKRKMMARFRERATVGDGEEPGGKLRGQSLAFLVLSRGSGFIRPDSQPTSRATL